MDTTNRFDVEEDRYAEVFASQEHSDTLRMIYREAYGPDYPEEVSPFGFVTRHDLQRLTELLVPHCPRVLVDLGCGRGGPGIRIARQLGGELIGIDVVASALADAARLAASSDLSGFRFLRGSFEDTTLPASCCDAVLSIDALWMVWDKPVAISEVARILRPGGRFLCTTWEPSYLDHAELFSSGGFTVTVHEETPNWLRRQLAVYRGILDHRRQLADELGNRAAAVLVAEARETRSVLATTPRVLLAATRDGC